MFADRLLEAVWAQGSWRGWMTLTSSGLQAPAAAFLLLLPLMGTTALPQLRPLSPPVSVAPPPGPHPSPSHLDHGLQHHRSLHACRLAQPSMRSSNGAIGSYVLNNEPVEVEMRTTVNFSLSGS